MKFISKTLAIFFIFLINYIFIFFTLYILSAFLLIKGITPDLQLVRDYQRNFYQFGGIREIWQSNDECIEFDKDLIFVPKTSIIGTSSGEFFIFGSESPGPIYFIRMSKSSSVFPSNALGN